MYGVRARLWGWQLPSPWWISWRMQAMNYQATRVNYPKRRRGGGEREREKKKRNAYPAPVAPGSLFQFREWFSQNAEGKGREGKRSSLEGVRVGWWGVEVEDGMKTSVCDSSPFSSFAILSRRQSAVWKCKMLLSDLRRAQTPPHDGWVWDLERPPVQQRLFPLLSSLFPHLSIVYRPRWAPGRLGPKQETFVINWVEQILALTGTGWTGSPTLWNPSNEDEKSRDFTEALCLGSLGNGNVTSVQITGWTWPTRVASNRPI